MLGHSQVSQTERDTHVTTQLGRDAAGDGRRLWDASAQLQPEINSRPAQARPDSRKPAAQLDTEDKWGGWGSNPRPADYESAALTG